MEIEPAAKPCSRATPCETCANPGPAMTPPNTTAPRCAAWSRQRQHRCERAASPGATVCASHGGKSPQVIRKARERVLELVDPALGTLAREMAKGDKSGDRIRAANSILDRAGIGRDSGALDREEARAELYALIESIRATPSQADTIDAEVVDAEIVEET